MTTLSGVRTPASGFLIFLIKGFGTTGITLLVLGAYLYLVKHPAYPVRIIPITALDRWIGVESLAFPLYCSLWIYLSLPPLLTPGLRGAIDYGLWMVSLCLGALLIFYFWPSRIEAYPFDWSRYSGLMFLKGLDAGGNACPSLHVATAAFAAGWMARPLQAYPRVFRWLTTLWGAAIVYSTLAIKQHLVLDVLGGLILALVFVGLHRLFRRCGQPPGVLR